MTKRKGKQISHKYHRNRARQAIKAWWATASVEGFTIWIGEKIYAEGPLDEKGEGLDV